MEEEQWHKGYADEEMENEEDAVVPAAHSFEAACCNNVEHRESQNANDYYSCSKTLVHNTSLNEEVHVPSGVEKKEEVNDAS